MAPLDAVAVPGAVGPVPVVGAGSGGHGSGVPPPGLGLLVVAFCGTTAQAGVVLSV